MTTFKYNGKIISTPNLEKKLKRMKITLDDIEIIDKPIKKEEPIIYDFPLSDYHYYKYPDKEAWLLRITRNPEDEIEFNNQTLKLDEEYNKRFLKNESGASRTCL